MRRRRNGPGGLGLDLSPGLTQVADDGGGGGGTTALEDFEGYADDTELENAWPSPGASYSATLHTSSPVADAQSCETTATGVRITSNSITTSEGTAYSILMRFDGGVGGDPGFYTHAQSTSTPFDNQVWMRVETGGPNIGIYVREGATYNDTGSGTINETLSTGTVYRLELLADAGNTTATATLYNHDTETQIGQGSCAYDTSYTGGNIGIYGDAVSGTQVYDTVDDS